MTPGDVRDAKHAAEQQIAAAINAAVEEFTKETGFYVTAVRLHQINVTTLSESTCAIFRWDAHIEVTL